MRNILLSFAVISLVLGCNVNVSDMNSINSSELDNSDKLVSPTTETKVQEASNNVRISLVESNGNKLDLDSVNKIIFAFSNNTTEILSAVKILEKRSDCPVSIKSSFSLVEENSDFILCKSYINRSSLKDVFFEINGKRVSAKSWVFSNQDKELMDLQINL